MSTVSGSTYSHDVDLLIVGAGPAGLYAAYYAGFRALSVAVVDSLTEPGGQLAALYPEKFVYDVGGIPSILGRELAADLFRQAGTYNPTFLLGHSANELLVHDDGSLSVTTDSGLTIHAKAIIITAGIGIFTPRRLPVGHEYEAIGVRYFVPDPGALRDKRVLVVGGGDSAVDYALMLEEVATSVTVIHRRNDFRAHEASVEKMRASSVQILTPYQVSGIEGNGRVEVVQITDHDTGAIERLEIDEVVAALGFIAELGPLTTWGMALSQRHIVVDTTMATTMPRIFAAGDITEYPGKVRLISVGLGEAATAVNNAAVAIDPSRKLFPGHSSDPAKQPG
ncbi:MAG: ferredoxin/flavodoxin---NADP+ reductase [Actinomycetota bacterium]|nr:ferredoxin/flavodoxin---NADP+ reductase [Actinomycetota bacterium]